MLKHFKQDTQCFVFVFDFLCSISKVNWYYLPKSPLLCKKEIMALSNNDIIKKLRVALKLRDDDIIEILKLVDYEISKTELSAFFRREDHPHYRQLKDQILRNFLNGLVIHKRGKMEKKPKADSPNEKPKTPKPVAEKKESVDSTKKTEAKTPRKRVVSFKKKDKDGSD